MKSIMGAEIYWDTKSVAGFCVVDRVRTYVHHAPKKLTLEKKGTEGDSAVKP